MAKVKAALPSGKLTDRALMLRAVKLARRCTGETGKISPMVGAVVARNGREIGEAFRGELAPGESARRSFKQCPGRAQSRAAPL